MLPCSSSNHITYHRDRDPKFSSYRDLHFAGRHSAPDGDNLFRSQFHAGMTFAFGMVNKLFAPFAVHVHHVFGGGSGKQVIGGHAAPIVTVMANIQAIGDCAIVQFVRKTVNQVFFLEFADLAIPSGYARTRPFPASVWRVLVDLSPEAIEERAATPGLHGNDACPMSRNKSIWVVMANSTLGILLGSKAAFLSASALAFAIGREESMLRYPRCVAVKIIGKIGGAIIMGLHRKLILSDAMPWGGSSRRQGGLYWLLQEYFSTNVLLLQPLFSVRSDCE